MTFFKWLGTPDEQLLAEPSHFVSPADARREQLPKTARCRHDNGDFWSFEVPIIAVMKVDSA